jgi:hypothetical protein
MSEPGAVEAYHAASLWPRMVEVSAASRFLDVERGVSMAVEFIRRTVEIPRGRGRRSISDAADFSRSIVRANVALNGFLLEFSQRDHHIRVIEVDTDIVSVAGHRATFRVECQYADKNFDDEYFGRVEVLVIADTQQ